MPSFYESPYLWDTWDDQDGDDHAGGVEHANPLFFLIGLFREQKIQNQLKKREKKKIAIFVEIS